jgi:hypothetical protein
MPLFPSVCSVAFFLAEGIADCQLRLQSRDPDEFAEGLNYLGAEVYQIGRGPFRGSVH